MAGIRVLDENMANDVHDNRYGWESVGFCIFFPTVYTYSNVKCDLIINQFKYMVFILQLLLYFFSFYSIFTLL